MTDLWYLDTGAINEQQLESLLDVLPSQMVHDIMRFRYHEDRRLKLFGKLMVWKYYQDLGQEFSWSGWQVSPDGKPFFEGKNFNISHSGNYVLAAFSDREIGVDIEKVAGFDVWSISNYFHPEEARYIGSAGDPNMAFFRLWTRKESYLKATGRGIVKGLHHESCLPDKLSDWQGTWYLNSLSLLPGYQVALCTRERGSPVNTRELFLREFNKDQAYSLQFKKI